MNSSRFLIALLLISFLQACHQKDPEPTLTLKVGGLFSYRIAQEGDGLVSFVADSTQVINEFFWEFGDGTTMTTTMGKTTHAFTKNGIYQVKLTAKNGSSQLSDTKTVTVDSRLARTFDDLPASERDTIRILYVLTSFDSNSGYRSIVNNPKSIEYSNYQNQVFIKFLQRTLPNHSKELDKIVFKGISYVLAPEDTLKFYNNGDPDAFFKTLLNSPQNAIYQKILAVKREVAASRVVFLMLNPVVSTAYNPQINAVIATRKYNYAGYAPYEGGYVAAFNNTGVVTHELGHSFGFAHDTQRDSRNSTLMTAPETKVIGTDPTIWVDYRELQVNEFTHDLVKLSYLPPSSGYFYVPDYWRSQFPSNMLLGNFALKDIATTPYYTGSIDLAKTISNALIAQYNIKQSPNLFTSISENTKPSGGRISSEATSEKLVYCR